MKISERLALIKAGYSKAEIAEMEKEVGASAQDPSQPAAKEDKTAGADSGLAAVLEAFGKQFSALTESIQKSNLVNDQNTQTKVKTLDDTINDILSGFSGDIKEEETKE